MAQPNSNALERLDTTSEPPRRARLATILWQSMNNLARSAATLGLTAVGDMATTLLPILQAAGKHDRTLAAHHVASLREGLLHIMKTVQELDQIETYRMKRLSQPHPYGRSKQWIA